MNARILVTDIETTGLDPKKHDMVSLGAVFLDDPDEEAFSINCKIYKDTVVNPFALKVNGFTREQIEDEKKPSPHEAYEQFVLWVLDKTKNREKIILAGENLPSFDVQFLQQYDSYLTESIWPFGYRYIDLHSVGLTVLGRSCSLDKLGEQLGLGKEERPHTAIRGALYSRAVLQRLFEVNK